MTISGTTATTIFSTTLSDSMCRQAIVRIVARDTVAGTSAGYTVSFVAKRGIGVGTIAMIGSPTYVTVGAGAGGR